MQERSAGGNIQRGFETSCFRGHWRNYGQSGFQSRADERGSPGPALDRASGPASQTVVRSSILGARLRKILGISGVISHGAWTSINSLRETNSIWEKGTAALTLEKPGNPIFVIEEVTQGSVQPRSWIDFVREPGSP
jgi:hypothetical protein